MNTLDSVVISSPYGKTEECAQLVVDDTSMPFVLQDIMTVDETYTLSFWIRSTTNSKVIVTDNTFPITSEWKKHTITFTSYDVNLVFVFPKIGSYWIYHPQLEFGSVATDWSPSPEDINAETVEAVQNVQDGVDANKDSIDNAVLDIDAIKGMIATLVTGENGESLMTQTENGWTFSMAQTLKNIDSISSNYTTMSGQLTSVESVTNVLTKKLDDLGDYPEYIDIGIVDGQPAIILGETDSEFKVLITNTAIEFLAGGLIPAYITNEALNITKATISEELQQGGFVWKVRSNGNYSLIWKGVD